MSKWIYVAMYVEVPNDVTQESFESEWGPHDVIAEAIHKSWGLNVILAESVRFLTATELASIQE